MGFTHVELLPVMAHPFSGSWGYQVSGYFAPDARHGTPDDFRELVDTLHEAGLGVILDWVPAHFPRDDWALARFDGTALYEHADPRRGAHPDWGTLIFNFGRHEVRNFLLASGLYWLREMHADGLRVDAVASMLYLDYSRQAGEWVPNEHGGREDLDAIAFLKELNEVAHARVPGVISAAEESTAWPGVSRPTYLGGLGFGFKWNMGWMHDTLGYFQQDPVYRRYHHHELTFSLMYAFSENFILPLSHDEVVHGKGSLLAKMPGDRWQQLANLRALYAYMWSHPARSCCSWARSSARTASGPTSARWTGTCSRTRATAACRRWCATSTTAYRDEPGAVGARRRPRGVRLARGQRRRRQRPGVRALGRRRLQAVVVRRATSRRCRARATASGCRARALDRGAQHRRRPLRRLQRREHGRRRGRGAALARPAVLGRGHAAAAGRGVARAGLVAPRAAAIAATRPTRQRPTRTSIATT